MGDILYRLFGWLFALKAELGLSLCLSVLPIALLLIIGYYGWQWHLKRGPAPDSPLTQARNRLVGLVIELAIWVVLLLPFPVTAIEAIVWQNWVEPRQRNQVRTDGNRLVEALEAFRERTGHYPSTLDELVPSELERVPTQPDGRPFVYTTDGTGYRIQYGIPSRGWAQTTCTYWSGSGLDVWECLD